MNIPFFKLPSRVQDRILWNMELDYDGYESSKAETIHMISCDHISSTNELIIKNYCKALSEIDLGVIMVQEMAEAERERYEIEKALKELTA